MLTILCRIEKYLNIFIYFIIFIGFSKDEMVSKLKYQDDDDDESQERKN